MILLDQLPRHCFRGTARAFAFDALARTEAKAALALGDEAHHAPAQTLFFNHALSPQRSPGHGMCATPALPRLDAPLGGHAQAPLILDFDRSAASLERRLRRFGRDPWRNAALGRVSTAEERAFLAPQGKSAPGTLEIAMPLGDPCLAGVVPLLGPLWRTPMTSDDALFLAEMDGVAPLAESHLRVRAESPEAPSLAQLARRQAAANTGKDSNTLTLGEVPPRRPLR